MNENYNRAPVERRFDSRLDYRIKDDPHWELRLKWVNSDKTLPIEILNQDDKWEIVDPAWWSSCQYREAKPWYEQEISEAKPMLLRYIPHNSISAWKDAPTFLIENYKPLTDQEIDALKRGF